MRYNTINKREKVKTQLTRYLIEFPCYNPQQAQKTVTNYVQNGLKGLSADQREDIRIGLIQVEYNRKRQTVKNHYELFKKLTS
jgi:hypothetical protein